MSSNSPHLISQKWINYDPQREDPNKTGDSFYITKNINGWSVRFSVDENGKISVIAYKTLGSLGKLGTYANSGSEAQLELKLDTTEHRTPGIKIVSGSNPYEPAYLEVDDRKQRCTQGFSEQDKYYKRVYPASSVLTPTELFSEMLPTFEAILKEKTFNTNVLKIIEETGDIQKPFNRSWKPSK